MSRPDPDASVRPSHPLRSAAWVLALAAAVSLALLVSILVRGTGRDRSALGDGRHPATYGFDLSSATIDPSEIVAAGLRRDGLPSLDLPPLLDPAGVDSLNAAERGKYLVADDLVIGVVRRSVARAYPLRVMNWHEVVNDTLGGEPILVTYNPLCDAAAVFARRVGEGTPTFGVSGLLYRSNLLMYDRTAPGGMPSLWSQLAARAVTGPAAARGLILEAGPLEVTTWADWRARHPETTAPLPAPDQRARYAREPYANYFGTGHPRFPVPDLSADSPLAPMDRMLAVRLDDAWTVLPLAGQDGEGSGDRPRTWSLETATEGTLRLTTGGRPPVAVALLEDGSPPPAMTAFWFAWNAQRPERLHAAPAAAE